MKRSMKWGVSKYNQRPGKTKGGKRYVTSQVYCTVLRPKKTHKQNKKMFIDKTASHLRKNYAPARLTRCVASRARATRVWDSRIGQRHCRIVKCGVTYGGGRSVCTVSGGACAFCDDDGKWTTSGGVCAVATAAAAAAAEDTRLVLGR